MGQARDWSSFLSEESKAREPSPLKALANHLTIPGIISLGGGLPNPGYFPFEYVDVRVPSSEKLEELDIAKDGSTIRIVKDRNNLHSLLNDQAILSKTYPADLATTLQYAQGFGDVTFRAWAKEHVKIVHSPPYENWDLTLTVGNTMAFEVCLRAFLNRGDSIIMDEYAYTSGIFSCRPQGINIVGIRMDGLGMRADLLDEKLSSWNESDGRKPRVAYVVPTGQNPSGSTMSLERRKELYAIFQKHDILIIEDDPYYFLQMEPYTGEENPKYSTPETTEQLLSALIPSFLKLDVDGRVVRLDSLSKILAPGIRLGFITASSQLIERLIRGIEVTSQAPSGFSQSIAYQLLSQHWGHDGFFQWLIYMRSEYTKRRDVCCRAIDKYLPKTVMEYTVPSAGMFFWIHVTGRIDGMRGKELGDKVFEKCLEHKVLVVPGDVFKAERNDGNEDVFFRGTFAAVPHDKLEIGIQRLGKMLQDVFNL